MIYFTSDLHLGHTNILSMTGRPFETVEEMNEALITNWNKKVKKNDDVYILGDFTLMTQLAPITEWLSRLNGRKHLIRGNHDYFTDRNAFDTTLFESISDYKELKYQKKKFILCHYPFKTWNGSHYDYSYNLHGHSHNTPEYNLQNRADGIRQYDVGIDANNLQLVSIDEIIEFFSVLDTLEGVDTDNYSLDTFKFEDGVYTKELRLEKKAFIQDVFKKLENQVLDTIGN